MGSPWPLTGPDRDGLFLVAGHLWTVGAPLVLLAISWALGRRLLKRWPLGEPTATEDLLFGVAIGLGALALVMIGLGSLGGYHPAPMALALLVPGAWAWRELRALPDEARSVARELGAACSGRAERTAALVLGALLVGMLLLRALPPAVDWDTIMYHIPVPLDFLEAGRIVAPRDSMHVAFFGLFQFLYVPLIAFAGGPSVGVLSALTGALLLVGVWHAAQRLGGAWGGLGALATVAGTTGVFLVAVTARVDTTLALYLWLGQWALLRLAMGGWDRGLAARATAVLGLAIGIKHLSLVYGVALAPVALWAAWGGRGARSGAATLVRRLSAMGGAAALLGLPVLVKNQILAGGPFYPYFTARRVPPWLADLLGSPLHPDAVDLGIYRFLIDVGAPFNLQDLILRPGLLSVEQEAEIFFLSPLLLLAPLALALATARRSEALVLLAVPLLYLVGVLSVSAETNLRYLIPAVPSLAVAAGLTLAAALARMAAVRDRAWVVGLALLAGVAPLLSIAREQLRPGSPLAYAAGRVSPRETILRPDTRPLVQAMILAEEAVPEDGRVLLLGEARGAYFTREVVQDNILTNWPLLSLWVRPDRCLEGTGLTHVLVNSFTFKYYEDRGMNMDVLRLGELEAFQDRCLELLSVRAGQRLYRVRS